MNIVTHFFNAAQKHPNNIAFVERTQAITFNEMASMVQTRAATLKNNGISSNDNILVMMPVSLAFYVNILALFQIGARVVLVDQLFPKKRLLYAFKKAECKMILTTSKLAIIKIFLFHILLLFKVKTIKNQKDQGKKVSIKSADDTALITFTSGTTGNPKAASRSHGFLNIQLHTIINKTELNCTDIHMTSFPVVTMCNLAVGATSILPPKPNQDYLWAFIKSKYSPTIISAAEYHFNNFILHIDPTCIRKVVLGGATLLPHFIKEVSNTVQSSKIELVYGSTEAEPIATQSAQEYLTSYSETELGICLGTIHPNLKVHINDPFDTSHLVGEILVAGSHVLQTYYQDLQAFKANKIVIGDTVWHRTGDAGYLKNRQLYYFGRLKYVWREGNHLYSPMSVEKLASEMGLSGAATVLRTDDKTTLFHTLSEKELIMLLEKLTIKVDNILFLKELPKDKRHQSRIDYQALMFK